jgi:predicted DNA-binding ribbon-helix-helix protein
MGKPSRVESVVEIRPVQVGNDVKRIRLERAFWRGLAQIAWRRKMTWEGLVRRISLEGGAHGGHLASAIRLFVLQDYAARRRNPGGTNAAVVQITKSNE